MAEDNAPVNASDPEVGGTTDVFEGHSPEVKVRTKKMMMWLIIFAIVMLFAGITSAMIVLYGKLIWLRITPPSELWISNALVVLSSVSIIMALRAVKAGNKQMAMILTAATVLLGIGFTMSQNAAWKKLSGLGMGYTVTENEEGLKAYRWNALERLSGEYGKDYYIEFHGEKLEKVGSDYYLASDTGRLNPKTSEVSKTFNAAGAMLSVLIYIHIIHLFFGLIYLVVNTIRVWKGKINKDNWISLYTGGMYWHFMGILWLYLFFFVFYIS
ncbi:MAG: cytochrome c oxidase subunit 3 [Flavobacteriales bacterium]